jgi:hypothetical protein
MKRPFLTYALLFCLISTLEGCRREQDILENAKYGDFDTKSPVEIATKDLAGRLSTTPNKIGVVSVENVTWRDGSLGCPKEDMMYTQALVEGTLIVLRVDDKDYQYHSGKGSPPFLCENPVKSAPNSSLN